MQDFYQLLNFASTINAHICFINNKQKYPFFRKHHPNFRKHHPFFRNQTHILQNHRANFSKHHPYHSRKTTEQAPNTKRSPTNQYQQNHKKNMPPTTLTIPIKKEKKSNQKSNFLKPSTKPSKPSNLSC